MKLLNTKTLRLEEFWDNDTPAYAILSHTWEKEEISFQAIADLDSAARLFGFSKIQACCRQACLNGYDWVWIDTCCIDKSSSAELSEAINSMFRYYKASGVCYAYLADVPSDANPQALESAFARSRWFTRGWTLQELISPTRLLFFSQEWTEIGSRSLLSSQISKITKIDIEVLLGELSPQSKSVAQRMAWASRRCTTRKEDESYCLMGLFDVNMPLLYGEGKKAFIRLQEEIIKRSNDHSLFAWTATGGDYSVNCETSTLLGGLLARSPSDFEHSSHYVPYNNFQIGLERPYSMTNLGLCIDLLLYPVPGLPDHRDERIALLSCRSTQNKAGDTLVGIWLLLSIPGVRRHPDPSHGGRSFSEFATGRRFVYRTPSAFEIRGLGAFGSKSYVFVDWNLQYQGIQAETATLYVPQSDTCCSPAMVAESLRRAQIIRLRTHPGWPPANLKSRIGI